MAGNALVDYAVEHAVTTTVTGHAPFSCLVIPFGDPHHPEDRFKATDYNSLTLRLKGDAGAGAVSVVTQQIIM